MQEKLSSKLLIGLPGGQARSRQLIVGALLAVALLAAACSSSPSGASSTTAPTKTQAQSGTQTTVNVATVGSLGQVLTGPDGHTLYLLTTEKDGSIQCTGSCAAIWPPLLVTGSSTPSAASGTTGAVGTVARPGGGTQVTYDGHPLYYYASDSASGQANGQGIDGVWFAVTPAGSAASSSSSPGTSTPGTTSSGTTPTTASGYGY
jgi:predicted lipoprotein with Yx(FWY)xxD motif